MDKYHFVLTMAGIAHNMTPIAIFRISSGDAIVIGMEAIVVAMGLRHLLRIRLLRRDSNFRLLMDGRLASDVPIAALLRRLVRRFNQLLLAACCSLVINLICLFVFDGRVAGLLKFATVITLSIFLFRYAKDFDRVRAWRREQLVVSNTEAENGGSRNEGAARF